MTNLTLISHMSVTWEACSVFIHDCIFFFNLHLSVGVFAKFIDTNMNLSEIHTTMHFTFLCMHN